jgi:branched-chain amino acid transport system permease protein
MFYREVGQFKTTYKADQSIFPILQDKIGIVLILLIAFIPIPLFGSDFFLNSIMIPFLIFALATIGLNILTGIHGAAVAGHRCVHGGRGIFLLQADHHFS